MKNMPYEKAFRGPKVDLLASFPNSTNIGETPCPTHSCVDQVRSLEVLVHLPALIKLPFYYSPKIYLQELQTGHICHDLLVRDGDVFNLVVQEYRLYNAVPFKGLNPIWYDASWPEGCRIGQKSIKSLSSPEMSLRDSDVSFH